MAKNTNQTVPTKVKVGDFIAALPEERQADIKTVAKLMQKVSGKKAVMWGPAIIGFDSYHYKYESGREGDAPRIAFSPRVGNITLYIMSKTPKFQELLKKLGKVKVSGVCIHVKKLSDIDQGVLEKMMIETLKENRKTHP